MNSCRFNTSVNGNLYVLSFAHPMMRLKINFQEFYTNIGLTLVMNPNTQTIENYLVNTILLL